MRHLHINATPCATGFKGILEACDDGRRVFRLETGRAYHSFDGAILGAEQIRIEYMKTFLDIEREHREEIESRED